MAGTRMNYMAHKWNWMFWNYVDEKGKEKEVIIYSPGSHFSDVQEYFVVVKFRLESEDWWLCKFDEDTHGSDLYIRVTNYQDQLREAMITCHAMNKLLGAT